MRSDTPYSIFVRPVPANVRPCNAFGSAGCKNIRQFNENQISQLPMLLFLTTALRFLNNLSHCSRSPSRAGGRPGPEITYDACRFFLQVHERPLLDNIIYIMGRGEKVSLFLASHSILQCMVAPCHVTHLWRVPAIGKRPTVSIRAALFEELNTEQCY